MRPTLDVKCTVKATYFSELPEDGYGVPGSVYDKSGKTLWNPDGSNICSYPNALVFNCPGCGNFGSISCKVGPKELRYWEITQGSLDDITTLSLSPSIHCVGCCGWHGYLTNGEFKSC